MVLALSRALLGCLLAVALLPPMAAATTIRAVSVEEMLEHAELVFEGSVSAMEVRGGHPSSIHTCVQFAIIEVLKGPAVGDTLELCFAGGTKDGFRRKIEGMVYPVWGETGVYFVTSLTERFVSPFYGWHQGHFRAVRSENRVTREVRVADGRPIAGIERTDAVPPGLSTGVARGVRLPAPWHEGPPRMTLDTFKTKLREILEGIR